MAELRVHCLPRRAVHHEGRRRHVLEGATVLERPAACARWVGKTAQLDGDHSPQRGYPTDAGHRRRGGMPVSSVVVVRQS
ncbi:phosphoglycan beta 1,3 galactosyltransferase 2 [Leishmania donovani]|uniref:Phosphoglycan beta 1,3 galactosyltransferase 2 n=1 Tax=Leishmania donovani TaxID=5661 RepID=E9BNA2_LEIDO|nr:phosphoglycan beta 1,3 galactosyltransferase 2 [Leishmania donovani]CBZ36730.1 phosphoglycan beta 1,3 galactosyltransferase 2 [Leishmania donovani]